MQKSQVSGSFRRHKREQKRDFSTHTKKKIVTVKVASFKGTIAFFFQARNSLGDRRKKPPPISSRLLTLSLGESATGQILHEQKNHQEQKMTSHYFVKNSQKFWRGLFTTPEKENVALDQVTSGFEHECNDEAISFTIFLDYRYIICGLFKETFLAPASFPIFLLTLRKSQNKVD